MRGRLICASVLLVSCQIVLGSGDSDGRGLAPSTSTSPTARLTAPAVIYVRPDRGGAPTKASLAVQYVGPSEARFEARDLPPGVSLVSYSLAGEVATLDFATAGDAPLTARAATVRLDAIVGDSSLAATTTRMLVAGKSGTVDTTFGTKGAWTMQCEGADEICEIVDLAFDGDGNLLALGDSGFRTPTVTQHKRSLILFRFGPDGTLDSTFAEHGIARPIVSTQDPTVATAMAIDGKGRIVVTAINDLSTGYRGVLARLDPNGTLDLGFASGAGFFDYGATLTGRVETDGEEIVVAGGDYVARFTAVGEPSRVWPKAERLPFLISGTVTQIGCIAVDRSTVLATGWLSAPAPGALFAVRFEPDGSPTAGYADAGSNVVSMGVTQFGRGCALEDGGVLYSATRIPKSGGAALGIARFGADGALDQSYGTQGFANISGPSPYYAPMGAVLQPDGKVVVVAFGSKSADESYPGVVVVARFERSGTADTDFGEQKGLSAVLRTNAIPRAVVLDRDGRIIVAGFDSVSADVRHPFVQRLWP
jgi:uncharacterized delta-60 repeat protein